MKCTADLVLICKRRTINYFDGNDDDDESFARMPHNKSSQNAASGKANRY